jgi:hypothetical protein
MAFSTPVNKDKPQVCQCRCFIVPPVVLRQYSRDANLDPNLRGNLQDTFAETMRLRTLREASRVAAVTRRPDAQAAAAAAAAAAAQVQQQLFDCQNRQSLPGRPFANPQEAPRDDAVRVVYDTTAKVAEFYSQILGRNSVDNQGIDLVSSVHYRRNFDNAFWNGQQMVYGDGDGQLFAEFWQSPDVIGHELTHGVTQYESGLRYEGESGALNESISDVFGAVFNQWLNQWPASEPKGWLIGLGSWARDRKPTARLACATCWTRVHITASARSRPPTTILIRRPTSTRIVESPIRRLPPLRNPWAAILGIKPSRSGMPHASAASCRPVRLSPTLPD